MSSSSYFVCIALLLELCTQGVFSNEATLSPSTVDVLEHSSITLTCTLTGNVSGWKVSDSWAYIAIVSDGTCLATGFINDDSLYSWNCHRNRSFSLTLIKIDRNQHGQKWICRQGFVAVSNEVVINVKVPVKRVEIISPSDNTISMVEKHFTLFISKTSYSRPTPSVKWFIRNAGKTSKLNSNISIAILSDEKGFTSVQSILNTSVSKEEQGAVIYCTGTNGMGSYVISRTTTINVYYAPEGGPYINEASNNSIYTMKEGINAIITCIISWGNPLPKLSWNCSGQQTNSYEDNRDVKLSLQWQTKRDEDRVCRCTSEQEVAGKRTAFIKTVVLYPPANVKIKFRHIELSQSIQVNKTIYAIENETYTLICEARSKPEPSYIWTGITNSHASTIFIVNPVTRENYIETCQATNVMKFSNRDQQIVNVNKSVNVEILYPPEINSLSDKRVIEGSSVNLLCDIKTGNPSATSFLWTREFNDKYWLQQSLMIQNVSRIDGMRYTCVTNNTMVMTGNIIKIGSASQNISLEVLYPPNKPTLFLISVSKLNVNITITESLTVVENTPFTLLCKANSLPKPNYYSWKLMTITNSSIFQSPGLARNDKKDATCNVSNTMVSTDGTSKTGTNERTVSIDIQYSPDIEKMYNISSEEGTSVNFSCPVIYGNPKRTTVTWIRRGDGQQWNGANFTLTNISRTDSAVYTCLVNNTMTMTGGFWKEGNKSRSVELNVLYKASVVRYVFANISENDNVTIAENRTVNLRCNIEGNPIPEGNIFGPSKLDIEKYVAESYMIVSAKFSATCFHKGIYTCRGFNAIKKKHISERNITLNVACSPRPDPIFPLQNIIRTYTNKALIINFTVVAYPIQINVSFSKYNGQLWTVINSSGNIEIIVANLDVQLTIQRVSEDDYGKYNLTVMNGLGKYEHVFYVEPPERITELENMNSSVNYFLVVGLPLVIIIVVSIVAAGVILYRKSYFPNLRKIFGKREENVQSVPSNLYQNLTGSRTQNNEHEKEYETISINQQVKNKGECEKYNLELTRENETTLSYQRLTTERKDTNFYTHLHTSRKKEDENVSGETLEEEKESAIYINMKI